MASRIPTEDETQCIHKCCENPRLSVLAFAVISVFYRNTAYGSRLFGHPVHTILFSTGSLWSQPRVLHISDFSLLQPDHFKPGRVVN